MIKMNRTMYKLSMCKSKLTTEIGKSNNITIYSVQFTKTQ